MAWLRAQGHARRRGDDERRVAGPPADRRLRHRRLDGLAHDAPRPRHRRVVGPRRSRSFGLGRRGAARGRRLRRPRRRDQAFGRSLPADRADRRPAGRAARPGLPRAGVGEVHLRHRGVRARQRRRRARRSGARASPPASPGGSAARPPTAWTGRSTPSARPCAGSPTSASSPAPDDLDRVGAGGRRTPAASSFVPALRRPGRAVLARRGARPARGARPETTAAHVVRALCEGIAAAGRRARRGDGEDLGAPVRRAARRRRAHPQSRVLMQTQADLLQLPVEVYAVAGRDRARRRGGRPAGPRSPRSACARPPGRWRPAAVYRAADRAGRGRRRGSATQRRARSRRVLDR